MAKTPKSSITRFSGDTDIAGTLAIAAPRALYAVAFGSKPKKNPPELLPSSAADCACGIRLKKIEDGKTGNIINCSHGSTYLEEKSVLTSGATPALPLIDPRTFGYISTAALFLWPVVVTGTVAVLRWRLLHSRVAFLVLGYLICVGVGAFVRAYGYTFFWIHSVS